MRLRILQWVALGLVVAGSSLFLAAEAAKAPATPVGALDCGCGGGSACVTKARASETGGLFAVSGGILLAAGAICGGASIRARLSAGSQA
jgi:hypothetical protein